jgi:parallel beta-helix repeat protein
MIHGKGIVAFMISMLMVCFVGNLFLIENCLAAENILYVGGGGSGNYTTIQSAIAAAQPGDTIFVLSGTYNENVYIDKSLNIIGYSKPVINGIDSHKSTIEIMSDNVTFSGFEIHNSVGLPLYYSGIAIGKQEIFRYVVINNCYISNAYYGIMIKGDHHTISNSLIKNIQKYGIMLVSGTENIKISNNTIDADTAGEQGINLQSFTNNNEIYGNTISKNRDTGLWIQSSSSNNIIYHNHFVNNYQNAYDANRTNLWYNEFSFSGNYWSDYNNYDNNSDEIGDIPYQIPPADHNNKDKYPLGIFLENIPPGEGNQPPIAYIIYITPNPAIKGETISFSGSGSDSDTGGFITSYNWRSNIIGQLSTQSSFTNSNLSIGVHTIFFKVMDNEGAWSTEKTGTVTINAAVNQAPIAYIDEITPNPAQQGEPVIFRGHGIDADGAITAYKWMSSKDGTIGMTSSCIRANLSRGTHTIYFQVKDDIEWSTQVVATLTIERNSSSGNPENHAPYAYIGGPYTGKVNEAITFNGSLSYDEEGTILGYWTFGDSTTGNGLTATHIYTAPGTYTVILTVTDEDGVSSTATTSAIITRSSSPGNSLEGFSILDFEIPFPVLMVIVVLLIVGILVGFIFKIKQR